MKEKSFETSLTELESIIKELESGNIPLEDAINKYTEAMKLVKNAQDKLENATAQVNKILKENGELENFTIEEEGV